VRLDAMALGLLDPVAALTAFALAASRIQPSD
jgi:hypothetical protein